MIVGSAEVVIKAVTSGLAAEIRKSLRAARPMIKEEGRAAGRDYAKAFSDEAYLGTRVGLGRALNDSVKDAGKAGEKHGEKFADGHNKSVDVLIPAGIEDALHRAGRTANTEGGLAGMKYSDGFMDLTEKRIQASLRRAISGITPGAAGQNLANTLFPSSLNNQAAAAGTSVGNTFWSKLKAAASQGGAVGSGVRIDFLERANISKLEAGQEAFRALYLEGAKIGPVMAQAAGAVSALGSSLVVVAGAVGQAAGSLAVLPGIMSAAAQGITVAVVASRGIGEAIGAGLKPVQEVAKQAGKTAIASGDSARAIARAQEGVAQSQQNLARAYEDAGKRSRDAIQRVTAAEEDLADAQRDVRFAQLALNDARKAGAETLQQLGFSAEEAVLAEQRAALDLEDAYNELLDVQKKPVSSKQREEAELAYKQAELNYREAKDRAQDITKEEEAAAKAGVEGTKEVVDAKNDITDAQQKAADSAEKLREAQENQADVAVQNARAIQDANEAVARSQQSVADAQANAAEAQARAAAATTETVKAVDKYGDALAKLSPAQQDFVVAVVGSRDAWADLRRAMGEEFFAGFATQFQAVTRMFTNELAPVLTGTATILGTMRQQFIDALTAPNNARGLRDILAGNNDILGTFTEKAGNGKTAVESLTTVFVRLGQAIQPVTQKFADWATGVVTGWEEATSPAKGKGNVLTDFFTNAGDAASDWGVVIKNVWDAVKAVFRGAQGPIDKFMLSITHASENLRDLATKPGSNAKLKEFFEGVMDNAGAIAELAGEIIKAFVSIGKSPAIKQTFNILTGIMKNSFGQFFAQIVKVGPAMATAFGKAIDLMNTIGENDGFTIFFDVLSDIIDLFKWIIDKVPGIKPLLSFGAVLGATTLAFSLLGKALGVVFGTLLTGPVKLVGWVAGISAGTTAANEFATALGAAAAQGTILGKMKIAPQVTPVVTPAAGGAAGGVAGAAAGAAAAVPVGGGGAASPVESTSKWAKLGGIIGKVGNFLPMVGIAFGALSLVVSAFNKKSEEAAKVTAAVKDVQDSIIPTLNKTNGAVTEETRAQIAANIAKGDNLDVLKKYPGMYAKAIGGVTGTTGAFDDFTTVINTQRIETIKHSDSYDKMVAAGAKLGISEKELIQQIAQGGDEAEAYTGQMINMQGSTEDIQAATDSYRAVIGETATDLKGLTSVESATAIERQGTQQGIEAYRDQLRLAAEEHKTLAGAISVTAGSIYSFKPTVDDATSSTEAWKQSLEDAPAIVDAVTTSIDRMNSANDKTKGGKTTFEFDAESNLQEIIDDALTGFDKTEEGAIDTGESIFKVGEAANGLGVDFNVASANGRKFRETLYGQRDATVAAAQAAFDAAGGIGAGQAAVDKATQAVQDSQTAFRGWADDLGIAGTDADAFMQRVGLIPETITKQIIIETKTKDLDLDKFKVDSEGRVIGIKVNADTKLASDQIGKLEEDTATGEVYMPIDANTDPAVAAAATFVTTTDGTVIGMTLEPEIVRAQESVDGFIRDNEGQVVGVAIDPDTVQAGADVEDFILDASGKPIGLKINPDLEKATAATDGWIYDQNGKKIALGVNPLANDPQTILDTFVRDSSGKIIQVITDPQVAAANKEVLDWVGATKTQAGAVVYELTPDANAAPTDTSKASQQVDGWIKWSDAQGHTYEVNADVNKDGAIDAVQNQVITGIDGQKYTYNVNPDVNTDDAKAGVKAWVEYTNQYGEVVKVPVYADVATTVQAPARFTGRGDKAGGYIRGPGGPTDDKIPSMLSDGEFVIRASSVKRIGVGRLRMLNSGVLPWEMENMPKFAFGGPVTKSLTNTMMSRASRKGKSWEILDDSFYNGNNLARHTAILAGLVDLVVPTEGSIDTWNAQQETDWDAFINAGGIAFNGELTAGGYTAPLPIGKRGEFMKNVASQMGTRYVWGADSPPTFDCSGLMSWALRAADAFTGRLTAEGFNQSVKHVSMPGRPGDLVTFDTGRLPGMAGHIGAILDPDRDLMMHTDGAGPARVSPYKGRSGGPLSVLDKFSTAMGAISAMAKAAAAYGDPAQFGSAAATGGTGVDRWRSIVMQALGITGQPQEYAGYVLNQMRTESSGNPRAINNWDSNARRGTPSKGLMQVIDPTFRSYALPPYNRDIYDPLSNIIAAIRYVLSTYGSIPRGMRGVAYDTGGILGNGNFGVNMSGKPERILSPKQTVSFDRLVDVLSNSSTSPVTAGLTTRDHQLVTEIANAVLTRRPATHVRVFIGERELMDIVDTQISEYDQSTAQLIAAGRRA